MWSRDTILSLRLVSGKLDTLIRLTVARAGCLRRGCRAGRRVQLRRWRVAASETDTTAEIPVVTHAVIWSPNTYRALKPSPSQRKSVLTEIAVDQREPCIPCMFMANIRGGFTAKADELAAVLHENGVDIACVTETFLNNSVPSEVLDIPGYVVHRNDRKDGRRCGGVAVLVRHDVQCQRLISLESTDVETLWMLYRWPMMPRCLSHVVVGTVYNPPSADDRKMTTHILNCLDTATREHPHAGIVVLGDFNRLRDAALTSYRLKQVVKEPT